MAQPIERLIVQRARALIASPQSWTQEEFARDACDEPVSWRSPTATRFCIWGALNRAAKEIASHEHQRVRLTDHAARALRDTLPSLSRLNDRGTHADVLALIDNYLEKSAA